MRLIHNGLSVSLNRIAGLIPTRMTTALQVREGHVQPGERTVFRADSQTRVKEEMNMKSIAKRRVFTARFALLAVAGLVHIGVCNAAGKFSFQEDSGRRLAEQNNIVAPMFLENENRQAGDPAQGYSESGEDSIVAPMFLGNGEQQTTDAVRKVKPWVDSRRAWVDSHDIKSAFGWGTIRLVPANRN
jgi:hypothetical protein